MAVIKEGYSSKPLEIKVYVEVGLSEWLSLPQDGKKAKAIGGKVKFYKNISIVTGTKSKELTGI